MKRNGKMISAVLALVCLLSVLSGCTQRNEEVLKSEGNGITVELKDVVYKDEILSGRLHLTFTPEMAAEIAKSEDYWQCLQEKLLPTIEYNNYQVRLRVDGGTLAKSGDEVLYAEMSFDEPMYQPKVTQNMEVQIILHNVPPLRIYLG
ncbi:MAG: hypothetical protein J6J83_07610 [Oscillospiraceae bacterium]|nr:hypothetical protein [Oscillospiraceae bacterium]